MSASVCMNANANCDDDKMNRCMYRCDVVIGPNVNIQSDGKAPHTQSQPAQSSTCRVEEKQHWSPNRIRHSHS